QALHSLMYIGQVQEFVVPKQEHTDSGFSIISERLIYSQRVSQRSLKIGIINGLGAECHGVNPLAREERWHGNDEFFRWT
ncbi:MAG: hypothetical protein ACREBU_19325, partial [Nitrososphaera sp.]